jgi:hypothetical protein
MVVFGLNTIRDFLLQHFREENAKGLKARPSTVINARMEVGDETGKK